MKVSKDEKIFLEAEVANSFLGKVKGLMFREIDENEGLLLVFDSSRRREIWMPFVPQDLSVIFIGKNKKVVDKALARKITFDSDTWRIYGSSEPCSYILECHASKFENFKTGESLDWEDTDG